MEIQAQFVATTIAFCILLIASTFTVSHTQKKKEIYNFQDFRFHRLYLRIGYSRKKQTRGWGYGISKGIEERTSGFSRGWLKTT